MSAHFGLDLSPTSIKIVEAQKKGDAFVLKAFGEVPTPANFYSELSKDQILIASAIKKLVSDARISTKEVVLAMPQSQVYSQVIQMPPMPEKELSQALLFEAEQYIPVPLDRVQVEYLILKKPPQGIAAAKMEVLLVAAQKEAIDWLASIITQAGLMPVVLETEMLAAARALFYQLGKEGALIDMGQNSTDFVIISEGVVKQINVFETGGAALTRAIVSTLSLSLDQAERYKRTYGLDKTQLEGKVAWAILEPLSIVIDQIKRSIDLFRQKNPQVNLTRAVISGGTALMPNLTSFLAEKLGMEILIANPFLTFLKDKDFPQPLLQAASRFSTSVGLAIREV